MTQFLLRKFIPDYEDTNSAKVRTAYGTLASMVGIFCNALLFMAKLAIGLGINSISIMADGFNNLSDAASAVISLVGVKLAEKTADKEHPFGHGRFEYIAALIVSFLILYIGFSLLVSSVTKILNPEKIGFSWLFICILTASVLVKIWLSRFYSLFGHRINSVILKATSADARNDVFVTSATILSVLIEKLTGFPIDGWTGLAVSVVVLFSGFKIAKDTLMPLLGEALDKDVYDTITKKVESYDGILGSHDLIVHNYGPSNIMASIHAEVANNSSVEVIHETIDKIERDFSKEMGIFLVIHMDPIEINDKRVLDSKNMIEQILLELDPKTAIHDFRTVNGEQSVNLIFDLVVPHSYNEKDKQNLLDRVTQTVSQVSPRYHCSITIENGFVVEN
ncbi:MAG: cation diffusion facilitator family transporter [Negativicutes bacterium]|nr:cation diffusion facilitator family transporter [Negativicutes bacterium]